MRLKSGDLKRVKAEIGRFVEERGLRSLVQAPWLRGDSEIDMGDHYKK